MWHVAVARSDQCLPNRKEVALAVSKPSGALAHRPGRWVVSFDRGDSCDCSKPEKVVLLKCDAAVPELGDDCIKVIDLECARFEILCRKRVDVGAPVNPRPVGGVACALDELTRPFLDRRSVFSTR